MTFIVNNSLTIEIFDHIKANGGKITVWKQLKLVTENVPIRVPPRWKKWEQPEYEKRHYLRSHVQGEFEWHSGWNNAECENSENPIPLIVLTGHIAGPGMIHAWFSKQPHCVPMTGYLEDFHFAGRLYENSLAHTYDPTIHVGFSKLYLKHTDRELYIKDLLENPPRGFDSPMITTTGCWDRSYRIRWLRQQNLTQQYNHYAQTLQGGGSFGHGKQASALADLQNYNSQGQAAQRNTPGLFGGLGGVL